MGGDKEKTARRFVESRPRITACYIVYNEEERLRESAESAKNLDRLIFTDGRYVFSPGEGANSTDRTKDICQEFGEYYSAKKPWERERDKRNDYIHRLDYGYFLYIDADEILLGLDDFDGDVGVLRLHLPDNRTVLAPRLFKICEGLNYVTHAYLEPYGNISWYSATKRGDEQDIKAVGEIRCTRKREDSSVWRTHQMTQEMQDLKSYLLEKKLWNTPNMFKRNY